MTGSDKVTPETLKALADGEDSPVLTEISAGGKVAQAHLRVGMQPWR
jgi:hypothetical protein